MLLHCNVTLDTHTFSSPKDRLGSHEHRVMIYEERTDHGSQIFSPHLQHVVQAHIHCGRCIRCTERICETLPNKNEPGSKTFESKVHGKSWNRYSNWRFGRSTSTRLIRDRIPRSRIHGEYLNKSWVRNGCSSMANTSRLLLGICLSRIIKCKYDDGDSTIFQRKLLPWCWWCRENFYITHDQRMIT